MTERARMADRPLISQHNGAWSNAALVVDAIANGGAAKLALACYGFKSDQDWAKAMKAEIESLAAHAPKNEPDHPFSGSCGND